MEILNVDSLSDLPDAAEKIIRYFPNHSVVAFYGPMGAGKTTLIREICLQMGVTDNVTSPTFALVNQYRTQEGEHINHFDFYRINKLEEVFDLGYEEYFDSGDLCLIEWPEKIEELLPENTLSIHIEPDLDDENRRTIRIDA